MAEIINYRSNDYKVKETYTSGVLSKREYYKSYDGTTYTGLKVSEDYVYQKDGSSKEIKRTVTIKFFKGSTEIGSKTQVVETVQK